MTSISLDFADFMRTIITMSLAGSVLSLLLFSLKGVVRDRLPKSFQYTMWLVVLSTFIIPFSKIVVFPAKPLANHQMVPLAPIYNIVTERVILMEEAFDRHETFPITPSEAEVTKHLSPVMQPAALFMMVWSFGAIVFFAYNFSSYLLFIRKLKKYAICANNREMAILNDLPLKGKKPPVIHSPLAPTPLLVGILHPMIVLQEKHYSDIQLQNILLHELTHLRRRDIMMKWFLVFAGALHWFNPIVHLVRREINLICELACDEVIIKNLDDGGKQRYGDTLIAVATAQKTSKIALSTTMGVEKKVLKQRLTSIMKSKKRSHIVLLASIVLLLVVGGAAIALSAGSNRDHEDSLSISESDLSDSTDDGDAHASDPAGDGDVHVSDSADDGDAHASDSADNDVYTSDVAVNDDAHTSDQVYTNLENIAAIVIPQDFTFAEATEETFLGDEIAPYVDPGWEAVVRNTIYTTENIELVIQVMELSDETYENYILPVFENFEPYDNTEYTKRSYTAEETGKFLTQANTIYPSSYIDENIDRSQTRGGRVITVNAMTNQESYGHLIDGRQYVQRLGARDPLGKMSVSVYALTLGNEAYERAQDILATLIPINDGVNEHIQPIAN
ncbi:MAG: M56 family metallopeptidase [Clostridium sp.]|jgi:beta-lactamase regulating signal transducer with metallopeptidase domain|nr:M56 family metallopeptidase [Clostridium sp.]